MTSFDYQPSIIRNFSALSHSIKYGYEILIKRQSLSEKAAIAAYNILKQAANSDSQYTAPSFEEIISEELAGIPAKSDSKLQREFLSTAATSRPANITIFKWQDVSGQLGVIDTDNRFKPQDTIQLGIWDYWDQDAIYISIEN